MWGNPGWPSSPLPDLKWGHPSTRLWPRCWMQREASPQRPEERNKDCVLPYLGTWGWIITTWKLTETYFPLKMTLHVKVNSSKIRNPEGQMSEGTAAAQFWKWVHRADIADPRSLCSKLKEAGAVSSVALRWDKLLLGRVRAGWRKVPNGRVVWCCVEKSQQLRPGYQAMWLVLLVQLHPGHKVSFLEKPNESTGPKTTRHWP